MKQYLYIDEDGEISYSSLKPNEADEIRIDDGSLTVITIESKTNIVLSSSSDLHEHIFYDLDGNIIEKENNKDQLELNLNDDNDNKE